MTEVQEGSKVARAEKVWGVWVASGEYESYSNDLRAVFATRELAEAHAERLRAADRHDDVAVCAEAILDTLPLAVKFYEWSAHVNPDGSLDHRESGEQWDTFDNEYAPVASRIDPWTHRPDDVDLFVEVTGTDRDAVLARYKELVKEARTRIATRLPSEDATRPTGDKE